MATYQGVNVPTASLSDIIAALADQADLDVAEAEDLIERVTK